MKNLKFILMLLFVTTLGLTLASCGDDKNDVDTYTLKYSIISQGNLTAAEADAIQKTLDYKTVSYSKKYNEVSAIIAVEVYNYAQELHSTYSGTTVTYTIRATTTNSAGEVAFAHNIYIKNGSVTSD